MANKKITELTALTTPASTDVLAIVDVAGAETKKITVANLTATGGLLTQVARTVTNAEVTTMLHSDTPITLVENIMGQIIVPVGITIVATAAGTVEPSGSSLRLGWHAATSGTADYFGTIRNMMSGVTGGAINSQTIAPYANAWTTAYPGDAANKKLQAWSTVQFTGGWDMIIYTTYYTITV